MEVLTASLKLQILIPRELFVTRNLELNLLTDNNKQINDINKTAGLNMINQIQNENQVINNL